MNREDIIRMAQEAGMVHDEDDDSFFSPSNLGMDVHINNLKRFAAIVAALLSRSDGEAKDEPVAHSVVAGALFDFMGWLTSREKRLILSSVDEASPAVEAITEFAKKRNLSLKYAEVGYWMEFLSTPPQQEAKDDPVEQPKVRTGDCLLVGVCASEGHKIQSQRTWVGLTDEEISELIRATHNTGSFVRAIEAKLKQKNFKE